MDASAFYAMGVALIVAGFFVIIVALVLLVARGMKKSGKGKGGAVVMIGPIPIVFGTDKESTKTILLLAIFLTVLLLIATFLFYFLPR